MIYNDNEDKTYENWLALYACMQNSNLSVDKALSKVIGKNRFDKNKGEFANLYSYRTIN